MNRLLIFLCVLCGLCAESLADTTGKLRPTANSASTNQWTDNTGAACTSANCYAQVNETSGANCSTLPGDSTVNKSATTSGKIQRYAVSLSSIPDDSTITAITVYACAVRGGSQNAGGELRYLVGGSSEVPCASTFSAISSYGDYSCSWSSLSITKSAGTAIEIGTRNTQSRDLWVTAIAVDITYSLPVGRVRRQVIWK